ncbi:hypothetical protein BU25DRAFT_474295 [Macroventuria anomochaeta]|uniref:Uncharacterized protein n=1 Tax=Macroventuria anomochaeta TaxID=301207 RepID=A0ACB6RTZ5_9PLEO|nr:uncharacterized protein BU25DRAFT_474295 [Macroventuria anomochaeta]KAF2625213.1 hypothetical protein BU25DRAFT_474295 [Macroventuria anomochaeta]
MDADESLMMQGLGEAWEGQMVVLQAVCRGSAGWVVSLANPEQVGFVVSMAKLQLIEGTGSLSPGPRGNPQSLANPPAVLGSIGGRIAVSPELLSMLPQWPPPPRRSGSM